MRKIPALFTLLVCSMTLAVTSPASAAPAPVLTPHTFTVELSPSGDPGGSGTADLTVDLRSGTVCYDIVVTGIGEPTEPAAGIGNAHIHSFSQGGAIAVDLETEFVPVVGEADTYQAIDCVTAKRAALVRILLHPADYYVNVHTTAFPGGAVQGSLG
jgi:hypothetical protein